MEKKLRILPKVLIISAVCTGTICLAYSLMRSTNTFGHPIIVLALGAVIVAVMVKAIN